MSLPIIDSCDDCGACCMGMCSPPFITKDDPEYKALPGDVKASYDRGMEGREAANWVDNVPCFWLNLETRKCTHYEHRPEVCRNGLVRNDHGCHAWREEFKDQISGETT